jgi:hypothetical protein
MADISILSRLISGVQRNVDLASNTLVVNAVKVGGGSGTDLTKTILDKLVTLQDGSDIANTVHHHDGRYYTETELADATATSGTDLIGDDNTYSNFTPTAATAKGAFAGIDSALANAAGTSFADDVFEITDNTTPSKKIVFQASGITAATTRTITMPDADVDLGDIATNNAKVSADGLVTTHSDVTSAGSGSIISTAERNKLSGIEALADVTDATNVAAAGATMDADTDVSANGWVVDEDDMVSDLATKVPTQQSVKAFVATQLSSAKSYQGGYNAATDTPSLDDGSPIAGITSGDVYDVTVAGTFFTIEVEAGDSLRATIDTPTLEAHWTIVQSNLTAASIKTQYESNADTNEFSDAEQTKLSNISGTNTGDEAAASTTVAGIAEIATVAEIDTGTDDTRTISPLGLAGSQIQTDVTANNAKVGYTAAAAKSDVVNDSITDGNTDTAPSENAVFDALAGKQTASANLDEADTFFGATDLSGSEAETLSDGSDADALHKHSAVKEDLVAGETLPAGLKAVRYAKAADAGFVAGRAYLADKDASTADDFHVAGLVVAAGEVITAAINNVVKAGKITATAHGFTIGGPIYLGTAGALTSTAPSTTDEAVVIVGMARDANTIDVRVQIMGIN